MVNRFRCVSFTLLSLGPSQSQCPNSTQAKDAALKDPLHAWKIRTDQLPYYEPISQTPNALLPPEWGLGIYFTRVLSSSNPFHHSPYVKWQCLSSYSFPPVTAIVPLCHKTSGHPSCFFLARYYSRHSCPNVSSHLPTSP